MIVFLKERYRRYWGWFPRRVRIFMSRLSRLGLRIYRQVICVLFAIICRLVFLRSRWFVDMFFIQSVLRSGLSFSRFVRIVSSQ